MNKEELLQELRQKMIIGEITLDEITGDQKQVAKHESRFSVVKISYIIGGAIVILGIVFFIAQIWFDIGSAGRIIVILGIGSLFAITGSALFINKPETYIGDLFHFMGGILIPPGVFVTLFELGVQISNLWYITLVFGILLAFYLVLTIVHKRAILTLLSIVNGTIFVYSFITALFDNHAYFIEDFYAYLTMVLGLSYILFAWASRHGWNKHLEGLLYFFGSAGFLGAGFSQVFDSILWQVIFFVLTIGGAVLASRIKSQSILVVSTLFFIIHLSYINCEHFANSIGWPISLIILGFIIVGIGYGSIIINRKYINKNSIGEI